MKEVELLKNILSSNNTINTILKKSQKLGLVDYCIGDATIAEVVWNYLSNNDLMYGIDVIDFKYFDKFDITNEGEKEVNKLINDEFKTLGLKFDVVNEAKSDFRYKHEFGVSVSKFDSLKDAINYYPTVATSIGVRMYNDDIKVYAPYGLEDLFNKVVRANKNLIDKDEYYNSVNKWIKTWNDLVIVPCDAM